MPYEDFTSFIENDPASNVTVSQALITVASIETRNTNAYVYKDYGVDHFGDFEILVETNLTGANTYSGPVCILGIGDTPADTYEDWNYGFAVVWYRGASDQIFIRVQTFDEGTLDVSTFLTVGLQYYLKVTRSGTTFSCQIYDDSDRTNLIDTVSITVSPSSFRYLYAFSSRTMAVANKLFWLTVGNLDLQEEVPNPYPTNRLRKDVISGYHCFQGAYMDAKRKGYDPLKLPDGTLF